MRKAKIGLTRAPDHGTHSLPGTRQCRQQDLGPAGLSVTLGPLAEVSSHVVKEPAPFSRQIRRENRAGGRSPHRQIRFINTTFAQQGTDCPAFDNGLARVAAMPPRILIAYGGTTPAGPTV